MKTRDEAVTDFLEEDRKYSELIKEYPGDDKALAKADFLYQEGVRVDEIALALKEK
jgi:hypothetical protein